MSRPRNKDDAAVDEALAACRETLKQRFPLPSSPPARKPRKGSKVLPLVLLALAAGVAWKDPAYRNEHFVTQVGQRQAVQLADGSKIKLDGGTEVRVSWHLRTRQVALVRGQALFDISPMQYRPFLVDAGNADIRVVGTRFNVNMYAGDVRVTVAQGKVAVTGRAADRTSLLMPGQQVLVQQGVPGEVVKGNAEDASAWQESRWVFAGTPLAEVVAALQRYYAQPIELTDPDVGKLPLSGVFSSDSVETLLALLPEILPVKLSREGGAVRIQPQAEKNNSPTR
ncbi:FecR domain-containing protein [Pseudomonas sp. DCB_AW]|uniref:FecR family protein n=1 Tax=Pseudomonas sp. DCB_AW TaxID=2993596 RepID=UPI002248B579|nr:FecR domain-containing protein [Pseudomonas sp. DCB_AW]MCX2684419.1 FecR domain-containing protein [Pseudomonas sp. DCB_AW]